MATELKNKPRGKNQQLIANFWESEKQGIEVTGFARPDALRKAATKLLGGHSWIKVVNMENRVFLVNTTRIT